MISIFEIKDIEYNLRKKFNFKSRRINSARYNIDSLTYLGPKIWNIVPKDIKKSKSLSVSKLKLRSGFQEIVLVDFVGHLFKTFVTFNSYRCFIHSFCNYQL